MLIESEIYTEKGPETAQISMKEASQHLSHMLSCASCMLHFFCVTPLHMELEGPGNFSFHSAQSQPKEEIIVPPGE